MVLEDVDKEEDVGGKMPRGKCHRNIKFNSNVDYFKPAGVRLKETESVLLQKDELEAIRLKDFENLDQDSAAEKMAISQPTFHRILLSARKKISDALINGKSIVIEKNI